MDNTDDTQAIQFQTFGAFMHAKSVYYRNQGDDELAAIYQRESCFYYRNARLLMGMI